METKSGIICDIFKPKYGDSSNGGISHKHTEVLLVLPEGGPFKESDDMPMVELRENYGIPRAVAINCTKWAMFGGCFIYSSDSRFPNDQPIKLFDRFE